LLHQKVYLDFNRLEDSTAARWGVTISLNFGDFQLSRMRQVRTKLTRKLLSVTSPALLTFFSLSAASGQVNFASLTGRVTDAKQAPMQGVTMVLRSADRGLIRRTFSDAQGFYQFTTVNPGNYVLEAEARGFAKQIHKLILAVNQPLRLDLTLEIGTSQQVVTVKATPPPLRTTDATLGELIDPTLTAQLPLDGRHVLDLAVLAPATTSNLDMGVQDGNQNQLYWRPGQGTEFTAAGERANANYYLLDGTTDSDPTFWALSLSPSPDAIEEFKVQTGNYSAEFGGAGGAQVDMITKSGSDALHGTAYEYLRNTLLDARVWNASNIPHLVQNQFGASLGGPIQKKNLLFCQLRGVSICKSGLSGGYRTNSGGTDGRLQPKRIRDL
jgi:hypothetical protein